MSRTPPLDPDADRLEEEAWERLSDGAGAEGLRLLGDAAAAMARAGDRASALRVIASARELVGLYPEVRDEVLARLIAIEFG